MGSSEPSLFEQTMQLEALGDGVYERDIDQTWWGWNGQFGGYILALSLEACRAHVAPMAADHRERALTLHFMRRFGEGRLRIEIATERAGRTVTNVSLRLSVDGKACGVGVALFASDRHSQQFQSATPPDLTPPAADEAPQPSPIPAAALTHFDIWPRHEGDLFSGADVSESGGWMRLKEVGGSDERALFFPADGYVPAGNLRLTEPSIGGTLDFTAHFREPVPTSIIEDGEPVRVVLRVARSATGYIDEDAEIWSVDGRLLMQTRQTRYNEIVDAEMLATFAPANVGDTGE